MAATSDTTGFSYSTPAGPDTADLTGATSSNSQGSLFSATTSGLQTLDVVLTNILSDNKKIAFEPYNNQFTLSDGTTGYSALHYATKVETEGLNGLSDVTIANVQDNQILSYDNNTLKFINAKLAFDNIDSNAVINSNSMTGASSTTLATSASIKAYVDAHPGDITGVTAGDGLTGGGNSGALTLDVGGTQDRISVGANAVDIDSNYAGQSSITTLGTITTGTWNGTDIADAYIASASNWNSKQAGNAALTSISGLTTAANKMLYTTGSNTYAVTNLTAIARTLLDDASDSAMRTTLGLGATAVTGVDNATIEISSSDLRVKADGINNTHIDFGTTGTKVNTDNLTEGSTNLYHTTARARASVSAGTGLTYSSGSGVVAIDGSVVTESSTDTLTNKTLTSPVLNIGVSGTAIKDEDNMGSNSASHLATQQSIKAYVDSVASGLDVKDSVKVKWCLCCSKRGFLDKSYRL